MRGYLTVPEKVSLIFSCRCLVVSYGGAGDLLARSDSLRICAHMKTVVHCSFYFFLDVKIRESYHMGKKRHKKMLLLFPSNYLRSIFSGRPVP